MSLLMLCLTHDIHSLPPWAGSELQIFKSRVCDRIFRNTRGQGEGHGCLHGSQGFVHQRPGDGEVRAGLQEGGHARVGRAHRVEQTGQCAN